MEQSWQIKFQPVRQFTHAATLSATEEPPPLASLTQQA